MLKTIRLGVCLVFAAVTGLDSSPAQAQTTKPAARPAGWLCGLASLLAACHPATPGDRLLAAPLLEAVSAGHCPVDRQGTLRSY